MRDEHRFREKIELSLENRHVRAIAFAALVFLGVAFSLGVLVGKRLASRAAVPAALDDLEALDTGSTPAPPHAASATAPPLAAGQGMGHGRASQSPAAAGRAEVTRPGTGNGSLTEPSAPSETARVRDSLASPVPLPPPADTVVPPATLP